jgi:very-short-patch-repair endonuclease
MGIDDHVMRLAELRNNLMRVDDLHELGLSPRQIRSRIAARQLHPVHRGVVSVIAPPLDAVARCVAACLAIPDGVLSFSTAGELHGIRRVPRHWFEMTIPADRKGRLRGVHFHRSNNLPDEDILEWVNGLRLTTPARTLFDLASVLDGTGLRSAVEDARHRLLVTDLELDEVASRLVGQGRPGSVMFRDVVDPLLGTTPVQSHYEVVVASALREAGLDAVQQHPLRLPNGRKVFLDFGLIESRLDLEIDPAATHVRPLAVAADKARDVQVTLAGWQPVRFTEEDVDRRLRSIVGCVGVLHARGVAA